MLNSIDVRSIDEYVKKIEAHGGTIVVPKQTVGEMGFLAYFKDTKSNIHGLWQSMVLTAVSSINRPK